MQEEQIDILNPDGTPAGYSCGRTRVHAEGLWHRTIHVWAFNSEGKILFQLRARVKENNPGLLDTSCAGHISAGDTSINAAVRELREELGVKKSPRDLEYLFEVKYACVLNGGSYIDNEYYDVYRVTLSDEEARSLVPARNSSRSTSCIPKSSWSIRKIFNGLWRMPDDDVQEYGSRA